MVAVDAGEQEYQPQDRGDYVGQPHRSVSTHQPHQKSILGDDSSWGEDARKFTVWDPDLELEKGNLYRIFGKERTYDKLEEIQIQISDADHVDLICER